MPVIVPAAVVGDLRGRLAVPLYCRPLYPTPDNLHKLAPKLSPAGLDLFEKMLVYDPACRIDCRTALQHPYFTETHGAARGSGGGAADQVEPMPQDPVDSSVANTSNESDGAGPSADGQQHQSEDKQASPRQQAK